VVFRSAYSGNGGVFQTSLSWVDRTGSNTVAAVPGIVVVVGAMVIIPGLMEIGETTVALAGWMGVGGVTTTGATGSTTGRNKVNPTKISNTERERTTTKTRLFSIVVSFLRLEIEKKCVFAINHFTTQQFQQQQ
jgi:hypothetical protein